MEREKILAAIESFCSNNTSRQRADLYDHLNKELGLDLETYNYKGTSDAARFACDKEGQKHETEYLVRKLSS